MGSGKNETCVSLVSNHVFQCPACADLDRHDCWSGHRRFRSSSNERQSQADINRKWHRQGHHREPDRRLQRARNSAGRIRNYRFGSSLVQISTRRSSKTFTSLSGSTRSSCGVLRQHQHAFPHTARSERRDLNLSGRARSCLQCEQRQALPRFGERAADSVLGEDLLLMAILRQTSFDRHATEANKGTAKQRAPEQPR
jgi:hypothetical protein